MDAPERRCAESGALEGEATNLVVPAIPGSSTSRSIPAPAFERRDCTLSALAKTPALTLSVQGEVRVKGLWRDASYLAGERLFQ
jgi:hypothetical protein